MPTPKWINQSKNGFFIPMATLDYLVASSSDALHGRKAQRRCRSSTAALHRSQLNPTRGRVRGAGSESLRWCVVGMVALGAPGSDSSSSLVIDYDSTGALPCYSCLPPGAPHACHWRGSCVALPLVLPLPRPVLSLP